MISELIVASFDGEDTKGISPEAITFPGLKIMLKQQYVYRNHQLVPLTSREFRMLVLLAQHPSWVFRPDQIYESIWKESSENYNYGTAVANMVSQIRHKLTPETPKKGYIQTVTGSGYRFVIPE